MRAEKIMVLRSADMARQLHQYELTLFRMTGWVCEKIAQNVAQPIFVQINAWP
jgi:hypothetical protein